MMNTERLHAIADNLAEDFETTEIVSKLRSLKDSLHNQVNNPQQAQHQKQTSEYLEHVSDALRKSSVNAYSPAWSQAVEELGAGDILGTKLHELIREIFDRNSITPSVAHEEITQLYDRLDSFQTAIAEIGSAFEQLSIGTEDLEPGECELGILVPRTAVDNDLDQFGRELTTLHRTLGVFSELSTGKRDGFQIRTISSSDLTVFLNLIPEVAITISIALERILAAYKNLLDVRKSRSELTKSGVPDEVLEELDSHIKKIMTENIETVAEELVGSCIKKVTKSRKNELENELKIALNRIANRIDKGYNIDVRAEPVESDDDEDDVESQAKRDTIEKIRELSRELSFLKVDGEPILQLEENSEDSKSTK